MIGKEEAKEQLKVYEIIRPGAREFIKMGFRMIRDQNGATLFRGGDKITDFPLDIKTEQVFDAVQGWLEIVRDQHIKQGDFEEDWLPYLKKLGILK